MDFVYNRAMLRGLIVTTVVGVGMVAYAQNSTVAGDYVGLLGPYHVTLHLVADPNGRVTGTADNPDTGMVGMICENIRAEGQTLSFTVPMVHGTWTGFVGANGTSLSGIWSQGANPMPLNFTRSGHGSQGGAISGSAGANEQGEVKWDDYVFKFIPGGNMAQVYQGGKLVGTIVTVNGEQRAIALPGTDSAKLQKSYQDYQTFTARSHGDVSPATATAPGAIPAAPMLPVAAAGAAPQSLGFANNGKADATGVQFEGSTVTVPRTDGMVITFAGEDVTIGAANGPMYVLRHKHGSVGRTFEQALDHRHAVGGGVAGGGIEFLRARGGLIYDSGMGGYDLQETSEVRIAKQLALVAVDAVDAVRKVPGHADFKPSGYKDIKEISQYRLRSDGSR
jgi:hypothetical protein